MSRLVPPSDGATGGGGRGSKIVLVTLGTRGDIQPFCVLGRALTDRGHAVSLVANDDYRGLIESFGLTLTDPGGEGLGSALFSKDKAAAFDQHAGGLRRLVGGLRLIGPIQDHLAVLMRGCFEAIRSADLVVYNAMAFFVGAFAAELGRPAIRLLSQPLLPTRRESLPLLGARDLGRLLNRASFESFRLLSATVLRRAFRQARAATGHGARLRGGINPLTLALADTTQLLAFSRHLAPDPGDWPKPFHQTGFLFGPPRKAVLPEEIDRFLAAGPPPIYVGFGSMRMNGVRNAKLVLEALRLRGGRAILARGAGGLDLPPDLPDGVMAIGQAEHSLLLPRVSAVVHHGGSGTVAAALRYGRPSVILPILGDQLYWGRKVAAIGASESPIPLGRIDAAALAVRMNRAETDDGLRDAAAHASTMLQAEPGLDGAVKLVETRLADMSASKT